MHRFHGSTTGTRRDGSRGREEREEREERG